MLREFAPFTLRITNNGRVNNYSSFKEIPNGLFNETMADFHFFETVSLFMKFNIIFDYFNNKIYIEPNENFNEPLE